MIKQASLKDSILNIHTVNDLIKLLKQESLYDIVDGQLYQQTGYHLSQDSLIQAKNDTLSILESN